MRLLFARLSALCFAVGASGSLAAEPTPSVDVEVLPEVAATPAATSLAQRLDFHGWSPDSRYVAYTRHYPLAPGREPREADGEGGDTAADGSKIQRMHRKVRAGDIVGFGRMVGKDVEAYAAASGYIRTEQAREVISPREFRFAASEPDGQAITIAIEVGRRLAFRVRRGDKTLFRHIYDRLYVGFEPTLHPSPDGCQALLVFHLDAGWEVDAAIFTFPLEDTRRGRCAAR